ncbi:MAG: hypothetical protein QOI80_903 [Solirubrobacteraceae bacterium]|nr:hypothetical protein [Solirubrobacteraceae bacterium]
MKLSVVIPTGDDRRAQLEGTLERLAAQRDAAFDVLVVDNGATGAASAFVASLAPGYPVPLRSCVEPRAGVSAARNRGVREAAHEAVLFLNDDTAPGSDRLVAGHAGALAERGPGTAVMGRIRYSDALLTDPFMRFLDGHAQFTYEELTDGPVERPGRVYTAHLSLRRADFERSGGFDERLVFGFEDAEFAHRLLGSGCAVDYRSDLLTVHDHPMTLRRWARRAERMGEAGRLVNQLSDARPPLAQVPAGPYWSALAAGARLIERVPAPYQRLPPRLRRAVYIVLNQGAYTRGYRRAADTPC